MSEPRELENLSLNRVRPDIAPQEHDAVNVLPRAPENRDVCRDIDPIAAEKSHFLSPNWPSMAACRGGALNV